MTWPFPAAASPNIRRAMMNTRHVADLMPTSTIWTGRNEAPCDFYPALSDATNSGILDVIRESTASKIFLSNLHAKGEDESEVYRRMCLNNRQIEIIANAIPKRQYYYTSEEANRLFELALGPLQLALLAVSDKESLGKVKELELRHDDGWLAEWLLLRGINRNGIS